MRIFSEAAGGFIVARSPGALSAARHASDDSRYLGIGRQFRYGRQAQILHACAKRDRKLAQLRSFDLWNEPPETSPEKQRLDYYFLVGVRGFEPPAPASRTLNCTNRKKTREIIVF